MTQRTLADITPEEIRTILEIIEVEPEELWELDKRATEKRLAEFKQFAADNKLYEGLHPWDQLQADDGTVPDYLHDGLAAYHLPQYIDGKYDAVMVITKATVNSMNEDEEDVNYDGADAFLISEGFVHDQNLFMAVLHPDKVNALISYYLTQGLITCEQAMEAYKLHLIAMHNRRLPRYDEEIKLAWGINPILPHYGITDDKRELLAGKIGRVESITYAVRYEGQGLEEPIRLYAPEAAFRRADLIRREIKCGDDEIIHEDIL